MFELRSALQWLSTASFTGLGSERVSAVCTDSRAVAPDSLFVALRGERFDAHTFAVQAQAAGAAAVMLERWMPGLRPPVIRVPDTRHALGELARGWRRQFQLPVVAVTGSNGKTTVKEMIAAIFAAAVGESACLATRGNLNNEVGLPQTLFRLRATHRLAVVELGMNRPGEIEWLASIARPTVALVNNAQREHQEFMSSVEATARENGAAIRALPADGVAVFPGDDRMHAPIWRAFAGDRPVLAFGLEAPDAAHREFEVSASCEAVPVGFTMRIGARSVEVRLAIDGAHNVRNALAAAACAHAAGVDADTIARGLTSFSPAPGRLVRHALASGATLIDDSYNANPDSVLAAIEVLAHRAGPRVLVLGDMGEVGEQGPQWHHEVGAKAAERGVTHLLLLGQASTYTALGFGPQAEHFPDVESLTARARELAANAAATLLVKDSRFMRMERVVAALTGAQVTEVH